MGVSKWNRITDTDHTYVYATLINEIAIYDYEVDVTIDYSYHVIIMMYVGKREQEFNFLTLILLNNTLNSITLV